MRNVRFLQIYAAIVVIGAALFTYAWWIGKLPILMLLTIWAVAVWHIHDAITATKRGRND